MVYAFSVQHVTISGRIANGAEEWSTGFFVGSETASAGNPTIAFADAVAAAWRTFFQHSGSYVSNNCTTELVKVSQLGTDGKTLLDNTVFSSLSPVAVGANAALTFPPQISLVATLQSSLSRGLAAKGRMYLPGIACSLAGGGPMFDTNRDSIATNLQTFFNSVNAAAPAGSKVILASKGRGTGGTGAANKLVTRVRVGNVFDTQRRRRNGITEGYITKGLT